MTDKVAWFELPADDTARAGEFYKNVFGWDISSMGGDSLFAKTAPSDERFVPTEGGAINGDISPRSDTFKTPLVAISVEDIDAKLEAAVNAGATIVVPRTEMPEGGIIWAVIRDTENNNVGLMQDIK